MVTHTLLLLASTVSMFFSSGLSQFTVAHPDRQCTNSHAGFPACNFNSFNCYLESRFSGGKPAWIHVKPDQTGPFTPYEKGYIYFDPAVSQGQRRMLTGNIAPGKKAICVDFHYATEENATVPINFYIQTGKKYSLAHRVEANTDGEWKQTSFSCCLPDLERSNKFAFEAIPTENGITAIDYMNVRLSNMPCKNGELVCYPSPPSQAPLEPGNVQTCPSRQEETGVPSCDFDAHEEAKLGDSYSGWKVSPAWDVRQKIDGSGYYDIIYSMGDNSDSEEATLLSHISDDVESLCAEVQFSAPDAEDLRGVFSVYVISEGHRFLWGEAYNYRGKDEAVWKRNYFDGLLPPSINRQMEIVARVRGLKIDYIHVMTSDKTAPLGTVTPGKDPREARGDALFTCPYSSEGLSLPLCGMTAVPRQYTILNPGWTEERPEDHRQQVFPGQEHPIVFRGTVQEVKENPARLTTPSMESDQESLLTFSYALHGPGIIEIYAEDDAGRRKFLWTTSHETASQWILNEIPTHTTGRFHVVFSILPDDGDNNTKITVGFAAISINTHTPPITTEVTERTTTRGSADDEDESKNAPFLSSWLDYVITISIVIVTASDKLALGSVDIIG